MSDGWTYWTDSTKAIVTGVNDKTPQPLAFSLEQNYPNPFNPTTKIKYSIPRRSNLTLKIYNVLGQEVATLVNEAKPAGSYEINWNANKCASGIYFYQIKSGEFIKTKKMILLK